MVVGHQPTLIEAANFSDNLCRWKPKAGGHYEAWFLTLNHRASRKGFWFRYTIDAPRAAQGAAETAASPSASLWATVFDRARPEDNFCLKEVYPIDQFAFSGREQFTL
ncbi:MAG TPA: hypothetical protein VJQ56_15125, partial [Blastocatellia bacterium]|nr:hypothetical protein [Blastocatellia bacterium]